MKNEIKKAARKVANFFYALPFGMKAGDELLTTSNASLDGTSIQQQVSAHALSKALLKGEVTQEVQELRWRMYKVDEKSQNYTYLGNGVAVDMSDERDEEEPVKVKFYQDNFFVDEGLAESFKSITDVTKTFKFDDTVKRLITCTYKNDFVRFKLEHFIERILVNATTDNGIITKLYFLDDKFNRKSVPFINQLKRLKDMWDNDNINRNFVDREELLSDMQTLSFSTYKATNRQPNGIAYTFTGPHLEAFEKEDDKYVLTYSWDTVEGGKLLSEIYASETMKQKYENKEAKETEYTLGEALERVEYCSVCGKEMNKYDADIQREDGLMPMCTDCFKKYLEDKEKSVSFNSNENTDEEN